MRKDTFLFILGILVFCVPFVGVPAQWKDVTLFVLGGLVVSVAMVCRLQHRRRTRAHEDTLHVEHRPDQAPDTSTV